MSYCTRDGPSDPNSGGEGDASRGKQLWLMIAGRRPRGSPRAEKMADSDPVIRYRLAVGDVMDLTNSEVPVGSGEWTAAPIWSLVTWEQSDEPTSARNAALPSSR